MTASFTKILPPDLAPLPLWNSLSELSEALSPGLQSLFHPQIKLNPQPSHCAFFLSQIIITETTPVRSVTCLSRPETISLTPGPWKNCHLRNEGRLGAAGFEGTSACGFKTQRKDKTFWSRVPACLAWMGARSAFSVDCPPTWANCFFSANIPPDLLALRWLLL